MGTLPESQLVGISMTGVGDETAFELGVGEGGVGVGPSSSAESTIAAVSGVGRKTMKNEG